MTLRLRFCPSSAQAVAAAKAARLTEEVVTPSDLELSHDIVQAVLKLVVARTPQEHALALARVTDLGQALESHRR